MTDKFELSVIEKADAVQVFTGGGVDPILAAITNEVRSFVPDTSTVSGRKDIASIAYKVAQSKVLLDKAGKGLVEDWKTQAKKVDEVRKRIRDDLDELKDEARKPLTDWEEAENAREAAEALAKEISEAETEAYQYNALFDREREIERKEAKQANIEEEKRQREETERLEREREEREQRIALEAEERARKEEQEKAQRERDEFAKKEQAAKEAAERAERDRVAAEQRAIIEREMAVKEAERKAQEESDRRERTRLAKEKEEREAEERRQANKRHRAKVWNESVDSLCNCGVDAKTAQLLLQDIDAGKVKNVSINY